MRKTRVVDYDAQPPVKAPQTANKPDRGVRQVDDTEWVDTLRVMLDSDALGYVRFADTWDALKWTLDKRYGDGKWKLKSTCNDEQFHKILKAKGMKLHEKSGCLSLIKKPIRMETARRIEYARKRGIVFTKEFPKTAVGRIKVLDEIGV